MSADPQLLLGKRVQVLDGPYKGHRFNATNFDEKLGVYWTLIDEEVRGFEPENLREIGPFRRFVRKLLRRK